MPTPAALGRAMRTGAHAVGAFTLGCPRCRQRDRPTSPVRSRRRSGVTSGGPGRCGWPVRSVERPRADVRSGPTRRAAPSAKRTPALRAVGSVRSRLLSSSGGPDITGGQRPDSGSGRGSSHGRPPCAGLGVCFGPGALPRWPVRSAVARRWRTRHDDPLLARPRTIGKF
jgi:hypothetical protein